MNAHTTGRTARRILDPHALADMLGISPRHLTDLRAEDPSFPQPRMLSTLPRWDSEVIFEWVAAAASVSPTEDAKASTAVKSKTASKVKRREDETDV